MTDVRDQQAFNIFDLSGRGSRREFTTVLLLWLLAAALFSTFARTTPTIGLAAGVAISAPLMLAGVRRLHDRDQSGWWMLISLVPLIGLLFLAMLAAAKPDPQANRFGPPPGARE